MNTDTLPTIGILGDGQLSMMMAQAYQNLGGRVYVYGETAGAPAASVADQFVLGESDADLIAFFNSVDVVTLENEFYDSQRLIDAATATQVPLFPDPERYSLIEDKLSENLFFKDLGIDIADFFEVRSESDLVDAPGYLKLAKGGYDGVGTYRVDNLNAARACYQKIQHSGVVLFEYAVAFKKELSLLAVAGTEELIFYPLVETHQKEGTCQYVSFPAGVPAAVEHAAQDAVGKIMRALNTKGIFAFEFFLTNDDKLLLNESAPRPHNSGHITLDIMDCSQFENHMRAVAGLPLKKPSLTKDAAIMVNLLGTHDGAFDPDAVVAAVDDPNTTISLYRKKQSRIKRKMGHINLWGDDQWSRAKHLVETLDI